MALSPWFPEMKDRSPHRVFPAVPLHRLTAAALAVVAGDPPGF